MMYVYLHLLGIGIENEVLYESFSLLFIINFVNINLVNNIHRHEI